MGENLERFVVWVAFTHSLSSKLSLPIILAIRAVERSSGFDITTLIMNEHLSKSGILLTDPVSAKYA